jgi:hypothetical protein
MLAAVLKPSTQKTPMPQNSEDEALLQLAGSINCSANCSDKHNKCVLYMQPGLLAPSGERATL